MPFQPGDPPPEPYRVLLEPAARRALGRLSLEAALAVAELFDGDLSVRPYRVGKPLRAPFEGQHTARRGEYRIRYRRTSPRGARPRRRPPPRRLPPLTTAAA